MNIASLLTATARGFPDRPAVCVGETLYYDYRTLGMRAAGLARNLIELFGLQPGDRVAIAMHNRAQYLEILFGCWHAGLVAVPINARLHPDELRFIIEDCGAALIFATEQVAEQLSYGLGNNIRLVCIDEKDHAHLVAAEPLAPVNRAPADVAWLFYTSGTTGKPKGAKLSHRNLLAMTLGYLADIDFLSPEDSFFHLTAQSHAAGLFALSHIAKGSHHVLPESGGLDVAEVAALLNTYDSVSFFVPPTTMRHMAEHPAFGNVNRENIRSILLGAMPVRVTDLQRGLEAFGPILWNGYGQGESPCTITAMSKKMIAEAAAAGNNEQLGSVGIARTGIDVAVADGTGRKLPPGEIGEVIVRGETVMGGYWNCPEASASTLRDGWLHTGDLGRLDERGFLTLLDRKKDMVISGGVNIYPREIEEILLSHPDVADAAVIGLPDEDWGERVTAVITLKSGGRVYPEELDALCLSRLARFKRPKQYEFAETLPRNAAGKVLKRQLRDSYATAGQPNRPDENR